MIQTIDFTYPSQDGVHTVHAREWVPEGRPRGLVQVVHGVAEHVGRYDGLARFLAARGYLVCGEDHLGHGLTAGGKFGYFGPRKGWELVSGDVRRLRELEREKHPKVPYVLLGHSMGSFLVRTCLICWPGTVDAAVLSGTGQESAAAVASGKALSGMLCQLRGPDYVSNAVNELSLGAYNKVFQPNRTSSDWLSRDRERVDAYLADPLCTFVPTVGMFRDMMGGLQFIANRKNLTRMDGSTPVYFLSGSQDPVGSMGKGVRKVEKMFRTAGCRDVTVKLYPGGRHEMFHELNRQEVFQDLLDWLESRLT
ncbi:alpha/beta fold hydrolase [Pseudoflavonifractor sp. 60]|uniref:alpha/beta hydrolase n=1 Tax=Pseudoflavonifractor sp. 60 TaxID=2304576 RepID=UPI00136FAA22|nr:alpha/beta hydrolase [Pseudoflavonifractor sp. 60]NBI66972.1 alpha/beta fold hydrolase [Pseudoflavonifractor sp. 60]